MKTTLSLRRCLTAFGMVAVSLAFAGCGQADGVPAGAGGDALAVADVVVYKAPTCSCCGAWIEHMREAGFTVAAVDIPAHDDLQAKKRELGVPHDLGSCHTAVVDGRLVEGHVPASLVRRMLTAEPDLKGLAAPGMPIGSPGMEGPGAHAYDVIAFGEDGSRRVFETVDPTQNSETR